MTVRNKIAGASEATLARFLVRARRAAGLHGRVDLLVTTNREIRELNRRFRNQDHATDVLSFPALVELDGGFAGDIAVSAEIAGENARGLGHRLVDELKILALHGVLHLAGYDHETDNGRMERKEQQLRRELKLPETLIERTRNSVFCHRDRNEGPAVPGSGTRKNRPAGKPARGRKR